MNKYLWFLPLIFLIASCGTTQVSKDDRPLNADSEPALSTEEWSLLKQSDRLHKSFIEKGLIVREKSANQFITDIASRIAPVFNDPFVELEYFIVKDATLNAFALPNGHIYLNSGLLAKLSTESELAFILAHEIAHVVNKDSLKSLIDRKKTIVSSHIADLIFLGTGFVYYAAISNLASYSRALEKQADLDGLDYLIKGQYNTDAAVASLKKLKEIKHTKEGGSVWSSHPDTQTRIKEINTRIKAEVNDDIKKLIISESGYEPGSTHQISTDVHYNFHEIIACKILHLGCI